MNIFFILLLPLFSLASLEGRGPLKNPILLVHGATKGGATLEVGPISFGEYFRGIQDFYTKTKTTVKAAELPSDAGIGERAAVLKNYLETEFRGQKVNIIAHSMGGLDARYLVSILKSTQVISITTIATPHLGSPLADWGMKQVRTKGFWYYFFKLFGYNLAGRRFLPELTTEFMKNIFNKKVKDIPSIKYFSIRTKASFSQGSMSYLLYFPWHWVEGENHPLNSAGNDGLVPLLSQGWGENIATLELDHLAQMNHHEFRKNMEKESLQLYALIYDRLLGEGF